MRLRAADRWANIGGVSADVVSLSDGDLARRITVPPPGGARAEEAELVRRYAFRVRLFGRRHLGDEAHAADLAQDVLETLLARLRAGELRDPDRLGSFVLGMARRMVADGVRRTRRREAVHAMLREEDVPILETPDRTDLPRLERCLEALSERERTIVVLTFHRGGEAAHIARELGLSPGNVRVVRHRALGRLRSCMEQEARA